MTNAEVLNLFKEKYPKSEVTDYRPLCPEMFTKELKGITIWLGNGDVIQYYPKEAQAESD